jgi:2-polyprenyl-3-methyl-5-hydroxy-6-metoxy-1,4-benzoquinol methylase
LSINVLFSDEENMNNVRVDPENHESQALKEFADNFAGKRVLEVGCGDGRVTRLYAPRAALVHAIDPDQGDIATAIEKLPAELHDKVHFEAKGIETCTGETRFEAVLMSWSL